MTIRRRLLGLPKTCRVSSLHEFEVFHFTWIIFLLTPLRLTESDAELNALQAMVDNAVSLFYASESSSANCTPQMLEEPISGDYSWKHAVVCKSNSGHLEVPIPQSRLGCSGWGLHGDLHWRRGFEAGWGLCCDSRTSCQYVRSRHVLRVNVIL
jgi:hypothetical protein